MALPKRPRWLGSIAMLSLACTACAGSGERPDEALALAQASIDSAEQAGAREYGAADLATARTKLTRARTDAEDGDVAEARRLAEQAALDARLAGARAETGKSRKALDELRAATDALREEANRPRSGVENPDPVRPLPPGPATPGTPEMPR